MVVREIGDSVLLTLQRWSIDFLSKSIGCPLFILKELSTAMEQALWQQSLDPALLSGMLQIACPNRDTQLLASYLMKIVATIMNPLEDEGTFWDDVEQAGELVDVPSGPSPRSKLLLPSTVALDVEGFVHVQGHQGHRRDSCNSRLVGARLNSLEEDRVVMQLLLTRFGMELVYVAAMRAVLEALCEGEDVKALLHRLANAGQPSDFTPSASLSASSLSCCITLDTLLQADGRLSPDVVAVVHRYKKKGGRMHASLYRGDALYAWLASSEMPTNPQNREVVLPTDVFRLSASHKWR
eukprot:SM000208S06340  [mRNA]  locus=s208:75551:78910:- [translate_table: standard]